MSCTHHRQEQDWAKGLTVRCRCGLGAAAPADARLPPPVHREFARATYRRRRGRSTLHEVQLDDLLPVGAEEAARVEPRFERGERALEHRRVTAPVEAYVVAVRGDERHLVEANEPALVPVRG